eukprot:1290009-Rhodomonas_salina.1
MDRALIRLGIEDGVRGLSSEGAAEELALGVAILLDSETHLLAQAEVPRSPTLSPAHSASAALRGGWGTR